jgi:YgiT-type zinc finger domain-containing protein
MTREPTLKISSCPTCGSRRIRKVRRSLAGTYRGRKYTVPELEFFECPDCGEKVYGREAIREIEGCYERAKTPRKTA